MNLCSEGVLTAVPMSVRRTVSLQCLACHAEIPHVKATREEDAAPIAAYHECCVHVRGRRRDGAQEQVWIRLSHKQACGKSKGRMRWKAVHAARQIVGKRWIMKTYPHCKKTCRRQTCTRPDQGDQNLEHVVVEGFRAIANAAEKIVGSRLMPCSVTVLRYQVEHPPARCKKTCP